MFRSVGAILFGIAADRYGRKWPFIVNNILFVALELVSLFHLSHWFSLVRIVRAVPSQETSLSRELGDGLAAVLAKLRVLGIGACTALVYTGVFHECESAR